MDGLSITSRWRCWLHIRKGSPIGVTSFNPLCVFFLIFAVSLTSCALLPHGQPASTNSPRVQQAPHARLVYVAIGASDTFGTGTDDPASQSWPADLTDQLGLNTRLVNLGIPGIGAHDALNVELPVAVDAHPDLVTVWLAVNDVVANVPVDSYSHDLDQLVSRLQSSTPHARIAIANVPNLLLLPRFQNNPPQDLQAKILAYNIAIANIAQHHHIVLVDLYQHGHELTDNPEYISNDGFHPSAVGYERIADIFFQILQEHS